MSSRVEIVEHSIIGRCEACGTDDVAIAPVQLTDGSHQPRCELCRKAPGQTWYAIMYVANLILKRLDEIEQTVRTHGN